VIVKFSLQIQNLQCFDSLEHVVVAWLWREERNVVITIRIDRRRAAVFKHRRYLPITITWSSLSNRQPSFITTSVRRSRAERHVEKKARSCVRYRETTRASHTSNLSVRE